MSHPHQTIIIEIPPIQLPPIQYTLPTNYVVLSGTPTYHKHGLATVTNCDFIKEPLFAESNSLGLEGIPDDYKGKPDAPWILHTALWAANHAKQLPGDFVECGVWMGWLSRAIVNYIQFNLIPDKKFYLLDTFYGIPEEQMTEDELKCGADSAQWAYKERDVYDLVVEKFKSFNNVIVIKGKVPDTLTQVKSDKIAFLSIDMNCAYPEIQAAEYFWDKIVPGGVIILDDYGWGGEGYGYINQKYAFDKFAKEKGVGILSLPTGQGMIIKNSSKTNNNILTF